MRAELIPIHLGPPALDTPRTEGIHVSSVLRGLAIQHGILKLDAKESAVPLLEVSGADRWFTFDPVSQMRMSIGLAWEQHYAAQLSGVRFHPGELCCDGIYGTPDGESLSDDGEYAIHEFKATYKSLGKVLATLEDQWLWVSQVKAYCKMSGATVAYLHVLFLCGDYSYPIRPAMRCWRLTFTPAEIDQTWDEILTFVSEHGVGDG